MAQITREALEAILGPLDGNKLAAIRATGANIKDITDAKALAEGKSDIVGQGEQPLAGAAMEVLTILRGKN